MSGIVVVTGSGSVGEREKRRLGVGGRASVSAQNIGLSNRKLKSVLKCIV